VLGLLILVRFGRQVLIVSRQANDPLTKTSRTLGRTGLSREA
jgi:hypothetical protein